LIAGNDNKENNFGKYSKNSDLMKLRTLAIESKWLIYLWLLFTLMYDLMLGQYHLFMQIRKTDML